MSKNIKLRVYFTQQQKSVFSNTLFCCQMFRNHSLNFLRQRYFHKKNWLRLNSKTPEYRAYVAENNKYVTDLKAFKEKHPSKEQQKANAAKRPVKPPRCHEVLESNAVALNAELTQQLDKAKCWLLNNLPRFATHLDKHGISIPMKSPQNICVFYNSLPLSVRKALGKMARNEQVLLYVLSSPRSCLVQVLQDLDKTFTKAFKEREKKLKKTSGSAGKSTSTSGFPKFKKIQRCGGIRFQLDERHASFANAWNNQQIVSSEFGELNWRDNGYVLPKTPAKMLTLKKTSNGHIHAVFYGTPEYNDKRQEQHKRAFHRKTTVAPNATIEEFFDQHSVAIDLNRQSGQIQVVTDIKQSNASHVLFLGDQHTEGKRLKKIKRREAYIKTQQQKLARQDIARKKRRGTPQNPNGLHRKGKHSARRTQTQDKIAKACAKDTNQAVQHMRDLVKKLIDGKQVVFAENLCVVSMLTNNRKDNGKDKKAKPTRQRKNNNRSQSRARFSMFMHILSDECVKNNVVLLQCDHYDPTSQLCSDCGYHWGKLDTTVRTITCSDCGVTHDRDVNATKNIKFLSLYRYAQTLENDKNSKDTGSKDKRITTSCTKKKNTIELNNSTQKPLAESVNGRQMGITHLSEIAHEELLSYIKGAYPIKTVISTIEKLHAKHCKASHKRSDKQSALPNSCATTHHPRFSKTNHGTTVSVAG